MRDYGKVYSTFWSSETTGKLSEDGKLLALYLLTCSHSTIAGVFRLPDGYVAEDLGWDAERVRQGFVELLSKGFANRCGTTKWVWIKQHLKYNKPENPNQRKSAAKIAGSVPRECSWLREFMRVCGEALALPPTEDDDRCETLSQGLLNQKQEQEQEQEQELGANAPLPPASLPTTMRPGPEAAKPEDHGTPACPLKQIVGLFALKCPTLPKPRYELWKDSAAAEAMRQRWKWLLSADAVREDDSRYATTPAEALTWFGMFFENVHASDFLSGRAGAWKNCDLGWLMKRENFMKVVQGNYANKPHLEAA